MAKFKVFVPYNFTSNDEKAIDFVIDRFGKEKDAEITLFHAYIPMPDIELNDKTVMSRLAGNMAYLRQKIYDLEEAMAAAAQRLISAGFTPDNVKSIFVPRKKDTAQDIIKQVVDGEFSAIVLNHHPSKMRKYFTASISKKVAKELADRELYIVG